jgi:hypothetical protein
MKVFHNRNKKMRPLRSSTTPLATFTPNVEESSSSITTIHDTLINSGMKEYFKSAIGGSKDDQTATTIITRLENFLEYTFTEVHGDQSKLNPIECLNWFAEIITERYGLLGSYCVYLENQKRYRASTIQLYLNDISLAATWIVLHGPYNATLLKGADLLAFRDVISKLRHNANKKKRLETSEKTMETAISEGRAPPGGLRELQSIVEAELPWARQAGFSFIDKEVYMKFMEIMFASLYVFAVQGRVSGVSDIRYGQRYDLLNRNFALTTKFKTSFKFGYQAVVLSQESKELLNLYINHFRCKVSSPSDVADETKPLWLRWNGDAYSEDLIGDAVIAFFKKKANLRCGTTMIRSLIETNMESLHQKNVITKEERAAVSNLNGHSSAITKNYYVLQSRTQDVQHAMRAFEKAREENLPAQEDNSLRSYKINWGTNHPQYSINDPSAHIKWSEDEIAYISAFVERTTEMDKSICMRLLRQVKSDPGAIEIFHVNHVTDTQKIRNGYEAYMRVQHGLKRKRSIDES